MAVDDTRGAFHSVGFLGGGLLQGFPGFELRHLLAEVTAALRGAVQVFGVNIGFDSVSSAHVAPRVLERDTSG